MTQTTSEYFYSKKETLIKRGFSFVIDILLVYSVIILIIWLLLLSPSQFRTDYSASIEIEIAIMVLFLFPIYQTFTYILWGQSLGKKALEIKIQNLIGGQVNYYNLFAREFTKNVAYIFLPLTIVFEALYFRKNKKTFIDTIFKTNVIIFKNSNRFYGHMLMWVSSFVVLIGSFSFWYTNNISHANEQTLGVTTPVIQNDIYTQWNQYENSTRHFQLKYPQDWGVVDSGGLAKETSIYLVPIPEVEIIKKYTNPNHLIYGLNISVGVDPLYFTLTSSNTIKVEKQTLTINSHDATMLTLTYNDQYDPEHSIGDKSRRIKFDDGSYTFWIEGEQYFGISLAIIKSMTF